MTQNPDLYVDLSDIDDADPILPMFGKRADGEHLLYPRAVNMLFGQPESGKTLVASAIAAQVLNMGGSVTWLDLDYNGAQATAQRLADFGVDPDVLTDLRAFRFAQPWHPDRFDEIVDDSPTWHTTLVIVDSVGELMALYEGDPNSDRDYTRIHRDTLAILATTSTVLAIDHEAKSTESRAYGASGTVAKKRAVDGALLRVTRTRPFAPGHGGTAKLSIVKDRHGALRAISAAGEQEPAVAVFTLDANSQWSLLPPDSASATIADARINADAAALDLLDPEPSNLRDVQARMKWSPRRAAPALRQWRATRYPEAAGSKESATATPLPLPIEGSGQVATQEPNRKAHQ